MKKLLERTGFKIFIFIMVVITAAVSFGGVIFINAYWPNYTKSIEDIKEDEINSNLQNLGQHINSTYDNIDSAIRAEKIKSMFLPKECGAYYELIENDIVVLSTFNGQEYAQKTEIFLGENDEVTRSIIFYLIKNGDRSYEKINNFEGLEFRYSIKNIVFLVTVIGLILFIVFLVLMLCSAGHTRGKDGIYLSSVDKIPFELLCLGGFLCIIFMYGFMRYDMFVVGMIIIAVIIMAIFHTFIVRIKAKTLLKSTVIYRCIKLLATTLCSVAAKTQLVYRVACIGMFIFVINLAGLVVLLRHDPSTLSMVIFMLVVESVLIVVGAVFIAIWIKEIQISAEKIAKGNFEGKIDTQKMKWDFKDYGETLNNISLGMTNALDERMKSERMKTQLITNVSHDIKTPLTSIINYVDLISKEKSENEKISEYTQVLSRQSEKLKRLITDLTEASKLSSGIVDVTLVSMNLSVMLTQIDGEYREMLEAKNLELVISGVENSCSILADGQHLRRVFDNLMGNIIKYALGGTRVYIDLIKKEGTVIISVKNMSRERLNINPSELMERFVRGDSSRNTEGNGLGLSIAQSLTAALNGKFKIEIDGDLFKVLLEFPTQNM